MSNNQSIAVPVSGWTFLAGIATGWALSLFAPKAFQDKSRAKAEEIAADFNFITSSENKQEAIKEVFGKHSADAQAAYEDTQMYLRDSLENVKGGFANINRKKYGAALKDAIAEVQETYSLPKAQMRRLQAYFEKDFDRVKTHMQQNEVKA